MYFLFREAHGPVVTRRLDERRYFDTDSDGEVGVELLFVSRGVSLDGLPCLDEIAAVLRAIPRPT